MPAGMAPAGECQALRGREQQWPADLVADMPGKRLEEFGAIACVEPSAIDPPIVVSTRTRRQPELMQGRLGIDHQLAATREAQFEQPTRALAVDVDHILVQ